MVISSYLAHFFIGNYFPGTGDYRDIGTAEGKNHSLNFPLRDGIDDESYASFFKPVMDAIMDKFRPTAIVLQCGADSLAGDRLGCFNLSLDGHAECVRHTMNYGVPILLLGGGGYTIRNVARCWCYETAVVLNKDKEISNQLPYSDYFEYYSPDYRLHIDTNNMDNLNDKQYIHKITTHLLETLRELEAAPNTTMHELPPDTILKTIDMDEEDQYALTLEGLDGPRLSQNYKDQYVQPDGEIEDSADEGEGQRHQGPPDEIPAFFDSNNQKT